MRLILTALMALVITGFMNAPASAVSDLVNFVQTDKAALPTDIRLTPASLTVSKNDMLCLALNDYWEARGESLRGRVAVAQVVMNRVRDPRFPGTICGVVSQNHTSGKGCQFSWYCDGKSDEPTNSASWRASVLLAMSVLRRDNAVVDPTNGALWFHTTRVSPPWSKKLDRTAKIGHHIFYTDDRAKRNTILQTASTDDAPKLGNYANELFADATRNERSVSYSILPR